METGHSGRLDTLTLFGVASRLVFLCAFLSGILVISSSATPLMTRARECSSSLTGVTVLSSAIAGIGADLTFDGGEEHVD